MTQRAVNLSHEVHLLLKALEGAILLAQQSAEFHFTDGEQSRFRLALPAYLVLLRERLLQAERVVRGVFDPETILIAENEADGGDDDNQEVWLPVWSEQRTISKLRQEIDRLERRQSHERTGDDK